MDFNLKKREFREGIRLRYDWEIPYTPSVCVCGDEFTVDHAMVCRHGGFIIQRHNELRDLEAEMLRMVCKDVEVEPVLQEITGEVLTRGTNKARMRDWTYTPAAFGRGKNLHSLTLGVPPNCRFL